ncbi:acyl-CoA synthetase [Cupriavidus respiraculi]|uniref:LpxL/LpxP family acyltransferase n=1 Tax=Cupriavidus respiraculi TaxID=195930 RepID=UPI001C94EC0E|nr:acyl-CoA synthetase [Cupriavidus respiraculi]MBY4947501.1 acyl-CoA synthetase [Cupriavidus respiraculi]
MKPLSKAPSAGDTDWSRQPERSNTTLLRIMTWISLRLGRRVARLLLRPVVGYFLLCSPAARRGSRDYLARALGRPAGWRDVARHMSAFATTIHDRVYLLAGRYDLFDIRVHGEPWIREVVGSGEGAFLMGAHLGSFEVIRAIGRQHPGMRVAVTMYEDNGGRISQALAAVNPLAAQDVIPLGRLDAMLQVRARLQRGYLIGLLADRTIDGRATDPRQPCEFLGAPATFPTGPLRMAAILRQRVVFISGLYRGGNRYDVHFEPIADFTETPGPEREAAVQAALARYVGLLEQQCRDAPYNWFNFYDFWQPPAGQPPAAADAMDDAA